MSSKFVSFAAGVGVGLAISGVWLKIVSNIVNGKWFRFK